MGIGLTQLINSIGDDRIKVQMLDDCMSGIRSSSKLSTITFKTDVINATDVATGGGKFGFIVWVDRDVLSDEMKTLRGRESIVKVKTAELSIAQMNFLRSLRAGKTPSRNVRDKTGVSLQKQGLVKFYVIVGWALTPEGCKVDIPDELMESQQ